MENQPTDGAVGWPEGPAPDPDLRAARHEIRAVAEGLRAALAADDQLAAEGQVVADDQAATGDRPAAEDGR